MRRTGRDGKSPDCLSARASRWANGLDELKLWWLWTGGDYEKWVTGNYEKWVTAVYIGCTWFEESRNWFGSNRIRGISIARYYRVGERRREVSFEASQSAWKSVQQWSWRSWSGGAGRMRCAYEETSDWFPAKKVELGDIIGSWRDLCTISWNWFNSNYFRRSSISSYEVTMI